MNTNSSVRNLTVVAMLLFSCLSWGQFKNREECESARDKKSKEACLSVESKDFAGCVQKEAAKFQDCSSLTSRSDTRADAQTCKADFDKYSTAASKGEEACEAFTAEKKDMKCEDKVNSCKKQIAQGTATGNNPLFKENEDDSYAVFKDLATYSILKNMGVDPTQQMQSPSMASCVKSIDPEKRANRRREIERSRRELLDKIKKLKDDIVKEQEEEDKKKAEVDEEVQKIDAEVKEAERKKAVALREQESQMAKSRAQTQTNIRKKEFEMSKAKREKAMKEFDMNSKLALLTDEKMKSECQRQMNNFKAQVVSQVTGGPSPTATESEKDNFSKAVALAAKIKAKGGAGSAELRRELVSMRKNCLQELNISRNRLKMEATTGLSATQEMINDITKDIEDMKKSLTLDNENAAKMKQEAEKEAADGNSDASAKKMNLSKKLENIAKTKQQRIQTASQSIQEHQAELNELVLNSTMDDIEISYKDASSKINEATKARMAALSSCQCEKAVSALGDKASNNYCSVLSSDEEKYKSKPSTRTRARK